MKLEKVGIPVMPAVPWDTTIYCCELEGGFIASLLGLGEIMKLYRMWDGTDEEIEAIMPQVEKGLLALMGCTDCFTGVQAVVAKKSGYVVTINEDGDETIVYNTTTAEDIARMPAEQESDNTHDNVCAGVNFLVERLLDDVLFSLDQAQLVIDQVKLVSEGLTAIMNTIPLFNATVAPLYDGFAEWVTQAATLGVATLKLAYSDPSVKLQLRENLYCAIAAHVNNIFQESDYFSATFNLPILESQSTFLADFMAGWGIPASGDIFETVLRWYNTGALNEDNTCAAEFDCAELFLITTFDESTNTVPYVVEYGTISTFLGSNALTYSGTGNAPIGSSIGYLRFQANFDSPQIIDEIYMDSRARRTGEAIGTSRNYFFEVWDGATQIATYSSFGNARDDWWPVSFSIPEGLYSSLDIVMYSGTTAGQIINVAIDNIEFRRP